MKKRNSSNGSNNNEIQYLNTVIVGGGHAGCNLGCWLETEDPSRSYIIVERSDCLLPQWKYARWQGFQMNTPINFSKFYGETDVADDALVRPLEQDLERWYNHVDKMEIKYRLNSTVQSVTRNPENGEFTTIVVEQTTLPDGTDGATSATTTTQTTYVSKNVICANGFCATPKKARDEEVATMNPEIKQFTPAGLDICNLNPGGVLIVGGGQSGVQLADLLAEQQVQKHAPVVLCTSKVGGAPRSFRGKDLFFWLSKSKFIYMQKEALKSMPKEKAERLRYGTSPILGATKDISLISLFRKGVVLLGSLDKIESSPTTTATSSGGGCQLVLKENRSENIKATVSAYRQVLDLCSQTADKLRQDEGLEFPPVVHDEEWEMHETEKEELLTEDGPSTFNLHENGITNIIWATGFVPNFDFLRIPEAFGEFDPRTRLPCDLECKAAPGLFFTGFPWVGVMQSANFFCFDHDHKIILDSLKA